MGKMKLYMMILVALTLVVVFMTGARRQQVCAVEWAETPFVVDRDGCTENSFGVGIINLKSGKCVTAVAVCE